MPKKTTPHTKFENCSRAGAEQHDGKPRTLTLEFNRLGFR